jgi:hypothetical protein
LLSNRCGFDAEFRTIEPTLRFYQDLLRIGKFPKLERVLDCKVLPSTSEDPVPEPMQMPGRLKPRIPFLETLLCGIWAYRKELKWRLLGPQFPPCGNWQPHQSS